MKITAIITAAGKGSRANLGKNKVLERIDGKTVLERAAQPFLDNTSVTDLVITYSKPDYETVRALFDSADKPISFVEGGDTRTASVANALENCDCDIVLIHDGARPFVTDELVERCIDSVLQYGSGVCCVPAIDTIGLMDGEEITETHRENNCIIQTPQGFLLYELKHAYSFIGAEDSFSDDAGVMCKYLHSVRAVLGDTKNVKLTYFEDFIRKPELRCGTGFDLHRLGENRKLILGGVEVEYNKGLIGHSDADALTHAVMDALLSAAGLKDIGNIFPDTDEQYKGISSMVLLGRVKGMLDEQNVRIMNVSGVIQAERPKLSPYVSAMRASLSTALGLPEERVNISCTTLEGIGIVGREEGIAAQAYALVTL